MSTLFDRVSEEHIKAIRAHGLDITYQDGETEVELKALPGRSRFTSADQRGAAVIEFNDQDFILAADDLAVDGVRIEPRRGAKILLTVNGYTYTYDVQPYGAERHWRWSGPGNAVRRVHGKLIDEEAAT